jgi:hypothetical protein
MLLVLDEQYLIERATQGLYWFVHEHERVMDGDRGWTRWNNAFASMVEQLTTGLRSVANRAVR